MHVWMMICLLQLTKFTHPVSQWLWQSMGCGRYHHDEVIVGNWWRIQVIDQGIDLSWYWLLIQHSGLIHYAQALRTCTVAQVHLLTTVLHGYVSPFASGEIFHLATILNRTVTQCLNFSKMDFGGPQMRQSREVPELMKDPKVTGSNVCHGCSGH